VDAICPDGPTRRRPTGVRLTALAALAGVMAATPTLAAPPAATASPSTATLGDRLRAIDAFEDPAVDPRLVPPPPPTHVWPEILAGSGAALIVTGLVGMLASPTCATRAGDGRCLDARGSAPVWPALVVVGLGGTVTASYWYRWSRLPPED